MEVPFHNLQDNLIYHANIFNYDKSYLMELINRRIKIDFSQFSMENQDDIVPIISFLKMSSKDQISELSTLLNQVSQRWQSEVDELKKAADTMYKNYQSDMVFLTDDQKKKKEECQKLKMMRKKKMKK